MSGEYINAQTLEEYWQQLQTIYKSRSTEWKDITLDMYQAIERSERADSDNHLNEERLGKDTQVIDICHYKYLPERQIAYRIDIYDTSGNTKTVCFQLKLAEE